MEFGWFVGTKFSVCDGLGWVELKKLDPRTTLVDLNMSPTHMYHNLSVNEVTQSTTTQTHISVVALDKIMLYRGYKMDNLHDFFKLSFILLVDISKQLLSSMPRHLLHMKFHDMAVKQELTRDQLSDDSQ